MYDDDPSSMLRQDSRTAPSSTPSTHLILTPPRTRRRSRRSSACSRNDTPDVTADDLECALRESDARRVEAILTHRSNGTTTPLQAAVLLPVSVRADVVHLLLADPASTSGDDVNAQDTRGRTALHTAVEHETTDVIPLLLRAGADPRLVDAAGICPSDLTTSAEVRDLLAGSDSEYEEEHTRVRRRTRRRSGRSENGINDATWSVGTPPKRRRLADDVTKACVRKENHVRDEQRRRDSINGWLLELRSILPVSPERQARLKKTEVLQQTVLYIQTLQHTVAELRNRVDTPTPITAHCDTIFRGLTRFDEDLRNEYMELARARELIATSQRRTEEMMNVLGYQVHNLMSKMKEKVRVSEGSFAGRIAERDGFVVPQPLRPRVGSDSITLNVGGYQFETTLATLLRVPDSWLAGMFTGRVASKRNGDGSYFIDRDGTYFHLILNFLRDGRLIVPLGFRDHAQLLHEAEFYRLDDLRRELLPYVS